MNISFPSSVTFYRNPHSGILILTTPTNTVFYGRLEERWRRTELYPDEDMPTQWNELTPAEQSTVYEYFLSDNYLS